MRKEVLVLGLAIAAALPLMAKEKPYDGVKRSSEYLTMPDGTRVAYDLFLPVKKGVVADAPLPALFKFTPYSRAWTVFDKNRKNLLAEVFDFPWYMDLALRFRALLGYGVKDGVSRTEWVGDVAKSGYAIVVADRPGSGASFGKLSLDPQVIGREASQVIDWIAAQPWCNGNVGMFGDSIQAQIQFQAAATGNPHLKAILPATTWMDNYSAVLFPGGILNLAFQRVYQKVNTAFDALATPVDSDRDGVLLAQARAERRGALSMASAAGGMQKIPFRDSLLPDGQNVWIGYEALYPLLARINASGVPVYLIDGWYDIYARDDFQIFRNLTVPRRLLVRPTDHSGIEAPGKDIDFAAEAERWFDYWLKGIQNGVMDEPPITYNLQRAGTAGSLMTSQSWPPEQARAVTYYLGDPLSTVAPSADAAADSYTVDYSASTGSNPHWSSVAMPHAYPDMRSHDAKCLTYTTAPIQSAMSIVGHPVARLWLTTAAPDLDLFMYLEAVDGNGRSTYVTQGCLRASHRKLGQAPFDTFGLPWRDHFQKELLPIQADTPMELVFDLLPTAYEFAKGQRIRISIAGADSGNFDTPVLSPAPSLRVLRDRTHTSVLELPVLDQGAGGRPTL